MRCPHNAKIRLADAWSVHNKLSTIETIDKLMMAQALQEYLSRFPKIDTPLKSRTTYLRSWHFAILPTGFWKKPYFSIVLWGKARFEPKYVHFSGCRAKRQHRGRSDQCKMGLTGLPDSYGSWHLYICRFRFGLSTFYVASLFNAYEGHFVLCYKEKLEPLDRALANFKRS